MSKPASPLARPAMRLASCDERPEAVQLELADTTLALALEDIQRLQALLARAEATLRARAHKALLARNYELF